MGGKFITQRCAVAASLQQSLWRRISVKCRSILLSRRILNSLNKPRSSKRKKNFRTRTASQLRWRSCDGASLLQVITRSSRWKPKSNWDGFRNEQSRSKRPHEAKGRQNRGGNQPAKKAFYRQAAYFDR